MTRKELDDMEKNRPDQALADKARNGILCLKDFIRQLKKSDRITDQEKSLCFVWLQNICNFMDRKEKGS